MSLSHRARAAQERDSALVRIVRVRIWAIGGAGALSLFFAALAHALAPGHNVGHSVTTPGIGTGSRIASSNSPSSNPASSNSASSNSGVAAPQPSGLGNVPQPPAQAPSAPSNQAPVQPSQPAVVGGGS